MPAVRHRHGRGRRPGASRRSSARAAPTPTPRSSAQAYKDTASAEGYLQHAEHHPPRGDRVHEGDLPLPGRDLRALPGAHRRLLPPGHVGAVLAPGDRVLRALRQPARTPARRPRAGRSGGAVDEHAGPDQRRAQRGGDAEPPGNEIGRMTGLTLFTPVRRAVGAGPAARASGWPSTCRWSQKHILQFDFIHFVRWTIVRELPHSTGAKRLNYPLPVLREQLRRALAALHRRLRVRHPQGHPLRLGPRHRASPTRRRPSR